MAVIREAVAKLVAQGAVPEWRYRREGFGSWTLYYRNTWYKIYETPVDKAGLDDYHADTPEGYVQDGYEDRLAPGSSPQVTGVHVDRFRKVDDDWTEA